VKVDWVDDWPVFNDGQNITLLTKGRDAISQNLQHLWKADLHRSDLELGWYQKSKSRRSGGGG
jgi:hypothetical protein